jgi:hypothetical protein
MLSKKEKKVYGDALRDFRPTIRTLVLQILEHKLFNLRRKKQSIYNPGASFTLQPDKLKHMPLRYIALVNNGTVVEMIRINEEAAELLLSKKTKMLEFDPKTTIVKKGMKYVGKKFVEVEDTPDDKKD